MKATGKHKATLNAWHLLILFPASFLCGIAWMSIIVPRLSPLLSSLEDSNPFSYTFLENLLQVMVIPAFVVPLLLMLYLYQRFVASRCGVAQLVKRRETIMSKEEIKSRRAVRLKKVIFNAFGKYIAAPWILSNCLLMIGLALTWHHLRPDLDFNGWPLIIRWFSTWAVLMLATLFLLTAIWIRLMIRCKGAQRTVQYLFPRMLSGKEKWHDRFWCRVLGMQGIIRQVRVDLRTPDGTDRAT